MTAPVAESPATEVRKYYGKYPAIVLKNDKPQNADHRGEVTVELQGILEEDPTDATGMTQRKMQVVAKPCLPPGFFFVPEPNDHVWVEFAGGEIDDPLWSGVWYPNAKAPKTPDGKAPTKDQKIIRTTFGHVVLLDDTSGKEKVVIRTRDSWVTLDDKGIKIDDQANKNTITMDASGTKIEDQANKNTITMDSSGLVLASGSSRKITVSSSTVKLE